MSTQAVFPSLVDVEWLAGNGGDARLRILDASWHLPGSGRDARAEFRQGHLPGAEFFDIDEISDRESLLPHMLPSEARFANAVAALGIDDDSGIVIYDTHGLFAAARAWWMFRVFGHDRVAILNGGLAAWKARGLPLEEGSPDSGSHGRFSARMDRRHVRILDDLRRNLESGREQVIDARAAGRFAGDDPEPRPGLRSGHIPGSVNVPFDSMIDVHTRKVLDRRQLQRVFAEIDQRPIVCTCGTGVSACSLAFGLHRLGRDDVAVYDGSWTEWGGCDDTPVETGP